MADYIRARSPERKREQMDVSAVQTRLGHASASITLGWYAHAISEKDHEAADLLGAILSGTKPQDNTAKDEEKPPRSTAIRSGAW